MVVLYGNHPAAEFEEKIFGQMVVDGRFDVVCQCNSLHLGSLEVLDSVDEIQVKYGPALVVWPEQ